MPVARPDVRTMPWEGDLLLWSGEVEHDSTAVIWAWDKLEWTLREAEISNAVLMCFELILLIHFRVGVDDVTFFVSGDQELVVFR